jgi:hypothetical protein
MGGCASYLCFRSGIPSRRHGARTLSGYLRSLPRADGEAQAAIFAEVGVGKFG